MAEMSEASIAFHNRYQRRTYRLLPTFPREHAHRCARRADARTAAPLATGSSFPDFSRGTALNERAAVRRTTLVKRFLSFAIALAASGATVQSAAAQAQFERLFYYVDREDSYRSLVRHIDQITVVAPQVYVVDSLGIMWGSLDRRVLDLAKAHRIKVMPLFTNEGFNGPALRRLLSDSLARARSVKTMVDLCKANGYWGIQFDVENLNIADRDRFTEWFTDAANALHAGGFTISAAVVHRTDDDAGPTAYHRFLQDSWRAGYDLAAMARAGDFISVMTYSEHTRRTPPGPVA